jgi:D-alanine-D-alanine ligase
MSDRRVVFVKDRVRPPVVAAMKSKSIHMSLDLTNKKIAVLMGGPGSERQVSLKSGEGVVDALRAIGADAIPVIVDGADFSLPAGVEIAFNAIHGTFGEDGQVQRILDARGVPYTGEGVIGSELAIDKIATKRRFQARGVPTAAFEVIDASDRPTLPLPFVIKAPREGSSVGVYVVKDDTKLAESLQDAAKYSDELLVEQYIEGRELTVGVVGNDVMPVIEIKPKKAGEFYDFANKYNFLAPQAAGADHICPAELSEELTSRVQRAALAAHRALDLEVYSRVDVLLSAGGTPFVLEINTIRGMTPVSLLPEAAKVAGISYPELCRRIIELSLVRFARRP